MAQPRKHKTAADRFRAYRERKKEREEALSREAEVVLARGGKRKRSAPVGYDAVEEITRARRKRSGTVGYDAVVVPGQDPELRQGLFALREEITRVRTESRAQRYDLRCNMKTVSTKKLIALVAYVRNELLRLAQL